tara:strand:+ start:2809 stop:3228 length:420 start_codon:yes stop_codon:yes gene_type:complete
MAHFEYHNSMRMVMENMRSTHIQLIQNVCSELGHPERAEEIVNKYVDDSIRIKKFKDKAHPKKPKSGYMLYCDMNRASTKKKLGDGKFPEVIRKMAAEWNSLNEVEKKKYSDMADDDKVRYAQQLEEYNAGRFKSNVTN